MKILGKNTKNKGYLIISTSILITILTGFFLLNYKIIIKKSKRLSSLYLKSETKTKSSYLEVFIWDEIYRIDKLVSSQIYPTHLEYIINDSINKRPWLINNGNGYSDNGFCISEMRFNGNLFYSQKTTNSKNFLELMKKSFLSSSSYEKNIFLIKMTKIFENSVTNEILSFSAIVNIEYDPRNKDIYNPNREILKEYVIKFETE